MPRRKKTTAMLVRELRPGDRVYCYARESGGAGQERSVDGEQVPALKRWCEEHGLYIAGWFLDRATQSGDYAGRREFLRLLDQCRAKPAPVHGVVLFALSRFGRDDYDSAYYRIELRRNGIQVVSIKPDEQIPMGPWAALMETFIDVKNRVALDDLSYHSREGIRANVLAGYAPGGRPPVGYRAVREEIGMRRDGRSRVVSRWVIDEEVAPRVRQAFELMAAGVSYARIHEETRLLRRPEGYVDMFRNRTYLGILKFGKEEFPGKLPALIDEETWRACQARMTTRPAQARKARRMASTWLLSGLATCGRCGALLWGNHDNRWQRLRYYRCPTHDCGAPLAKAAAMEAHTRQAVLDRLTPANLTAVFARLQQVIADNTVADELADLATEIGGLRRVVGNLLDAIEAGGGAQVAGRLAVREAELARLEERRRALEQRQRMAATVLDQATIERVVAAMQADVASEDVDVVRRAISQYVAAVIHREGEFEVVFRRDDGGGNTGINGVPPTGCGMSPVELRLVDILLSGYK